MCNDNKLNDKWLIDPHGKYKSIEPSLFFFFFKFRSFQREQLFNFIRLVGIISLAQKASHWGELTRQAFDRLFDRPYLI